MPWWGWIVVGAVLLGSETIVPSDFYLVFLGTAALAVGLFGLAGLEAPVWGQWLLFAALSVISLVWFRNRVRPRFQTHEGDVGDALVGEIAYLRETVSPGAIGRAELRGATWTARNVDEVPLERGSRARVERVEGLVIHLRREGQPNTPSQGDR